MLHQKLNRRSPLSVIRNQLKQNSSMSRSISPDYSPASRTVKNLSFCVPSRSSFKSENAKPTRSNAKHLELQSKRKKLMRESKILEEKVKEIKKKVQVEVNVARGKTNRAAQGKRKMLEGVFVLAKRNCRKRVFELFKEFNKTLLKREEEGLAFRRTRIMKKTFFYIKKIAWPRILKNKEKVEISIRHFRLQLLLKSFCWWQEHVSLQKTGDKSCQEEMNSLIDSFIQDSMIVN